MRQMTEPPGHTGRAVIIIRPYCDSHLRERYVAKSFIYGYMFTGRQPNSRGPCSFLYAPNLGEAQLLQTNSLTPRNNLTLTCDMCQMSYPGEMPQNDHTLLLQDI